MREVNRHGVVNRTAVETTTLSHPSRRRDRQPNTDGTPPDCHTTCSRAEVEALKGWKAFRAGWITVLIYVIQNQTTRLTYLSEETRGIDFHPNVEVLQLYFAHHVTNLCTQGAKAAGLWVWLWVVNNACDSRGELLPPWIGKLKYHMYRLEAWVAADSAWFRCPA